MNTTSYWVDTATLPRFPRPAEDVRVDVIVIGGGITGITAAYLCKRAGMTVALLERSRCASIDTGHTTAHVTCVPDERLHHLAKVFGDDAAKAVWDAGGAAIDQIVKLIRAEDIECDFKWLPGFLHAPWGEVGEKVMDELKEDAKVAQRLSIRATYTESIPGLGVPGLRFARQAIFHPRKYLSALVRQIPGKGSHVFEQANADEVTDEPLAVKTGGQTIRGKHLIVATHNPIMGLTGTTAALLLQTKLALYTSYAIGARLPSDTLPEASYWDTSDPYYYLRVEKRHGFDYAIFGGEDHKTGQETDTAAIYARLENKFRELAPAADVDHRWSGQVIETNDGLPLIGETASHQFVATGFAGNGMTFGTLGAMMAVDALRQKRNPWSELFDVHRKKLLGGTWRYLVENKDYPYHLVRDRLAAADGESLRELKRNEGKILSLDGKKVAAHRDAAGKVTLCSPVCTHLGCIVGWNNAEQTWDCPCHGGRFKPTGEVLSGPPEEPLAQVEVAAK